MVLGVSPAVFPPASQSRHLLSPEQPCPLARGGAQGETPVQSPRADISLYGEKPPTTLPGILWSARPVGSPCGHRIPASKSLPAGRWVNLVFADRKLNSDVRLVRPNWVSGVSLGPARDWTGLHGLSQCPGKGAAFRSALGWAGTPDTSGAGQALPLTRSFFRVANIFPSVQAWWGPHGPCGLALPLWGIQRLHSVNAKGSCLVGAGQVPGHTISCPPSPFLCQMAGGGLQLATLSVEKSNV